MNTILVVCIGNICRSPMAEGLLKTQLPDMAIHSAGLGALVGHPAAPLALEIAAEHGVDISSHRARQLAGWMCTKADLILVMEQSHKQEIQRQYPYTRGKVHCLGDTGPNATDIADPYHQPRTAFEIAYAAIELGVRHWAERIRLIA